MLEGGSYGTIDKLAAGEGINSSYVSRVMRLTLLAPDIWETILYGRQSERVTLPALMAPLPGSCRACTGARRARTPRGAAARP
ncbi:hypothetical protein GCM10011504_50840 [Siccirubricoccus deserti]|nr:hypothetical protein GCM10011504_50840 [Siccirubricoccus deserti]